MKEAFGYIRVSGMGQVDKDGPIRQRIAIEDYARKNDLIITRWFEEKGVCGATEWEERPAWSEMVENLNGIRTIVVERLDRLARELFIQEYILRDLKKRNVSLLTTAHEDTSEADPTRVLFRQILGAIAQYDRVMTVRKLKAARDRKRKKEGRCEGVLPFGRTVEERMTLENMKRWREAGFNIQTITNKLNELGIPSPSGKPHWCVSTVHSILTRENIKKGVPGVVVG